MCTLGLFIAKKEDEENFMTTEPTAYGNLCTLFYNATKAHPPVRELAFYTSFIEQNLGRVLEAMSGSGRLLIPFMQRGYTVDGVDNSETMLASCRERCAQLNLFPELYNQSLQDLSLPHTYATVTIAVGSFQLICDKNQALESLKKIRAHMQPGGNLLIDMFTPNLSSPEKHSTSLIRVGHNRTIRLRTREILDESNRRSAAFCHYELMVNGIVESQEDELIEVTWYTDDEIRELFEKAGFSLAAIHDETFRSSGPSRIFQAQPDQKS